MSSLADLTLAAQQRCDRVNATTISTAEWYSMVNASVQELYAKLTSTNEDYNVQSYAFTLPGNGQNSIQVGPGTGVPNFFHPRALWGQFGVGSPSQYVTIPRLESFLERNFFTYPAIVPVYGAVASRWNLIGNMIEILPPGVSGASYLLWYVPTMPVLVNPTDTIDAYWLTVNGWQEYVIYDVAMKSLLKEESLDAAQIMNQLKNEIGMRILTEAKPRDISQPKSIVDMQRVRNPWGGWGAYGGFGAGGSGSDGSSGSW